MGAFVFFRAAPECDSHSKENIPSLIIFVEVFRYCRADRRESVVIQSKTQCVLSPQAVCTVVVGMEGSLCVSVGWCSYLTGSREILKPHVSLGLFTCTLISKTRSTTAPRWWCLTSFLPHECTEKSWNSLLACDCYFINGDLCF